MNNLEDSSHKDFLLVLSIKEQNDRIHSFLQTNSEEEILANLKAFALIALPKCPDFELKVSRLKYPWQIYFDDSFISNDFSSLKRKITGVILEFKNLLNISLYYNNKDVINILLQYPFKIDLVTLEAALLGSGYKYFDILLPRVQSLKLEQRNCYFFNKIEEFIKEEKIYLPITPEFYFLKQHSTANFNNGQEFLWQISHRCKLNLEYLVTTFADFGFYFSPSSFFKNSPLKSLVILQLNDRIVKDFHRHTSEDSFEEYHQQ